MGIRVHKYIGYGLADLDATGEEVRDGRVNADYLLRGMYDDTRSAAAYEVAVDAYNAGMEDPRARVHTFALDKTTPNWEPMDSICWRAEYGDPRVLLLAPPGYSDWRRYDDTIDWIEETYFADPPQGNRVKILPHGIYPFSGLYMDSRTGERLTDVMDWVRFRSSVREGGDVPTDLLDETAQAAGYADDAEAGEYVVPWVPTEITFLAKFLGVFTDDAVALQLRPMLYTWWG